MTEEPKWTPGPWHVNGGNAALPDGREIPCWTDADARLIAAAPDMAELLEQIAAGRPPLGGETSVAYELWAQGVALRAHDLLNRIHGENG